MLISIIIMLSIKSNKQNYSNLSIVSFPVSYAGTHTRQLVGQACLGGLLGLGSQRIMVAGFVADIPWVLPFSGNVR